MDRIVEIIYENIVLDEKYEKIVNTVFDKCFEIEEIDNKNLYVSVILSDEDYIHKINKQYRNMDKPTDVLSFPMFENKAEMLKIKNEEFDTIGDIIVCIPIVEKQAIEYEHSFERELAYMLVHGFYHLMGYDHIKDEDKKKMRVKEEYMLQKLNILN